MKKIFKTEKDFDGFYSANNWLKEYEYFEGSMQRGAPIGLSKEDWVEGCKWRNLTQEGKESLDGIIAAGDKRNGDVTIIIFDEKDKKEDYINYKEW